MFCGWGSCGLIHTVCHPGQSWNSLPLPLSLPLSHTETVGKLATMAQHTLLMGPFVVNALWRLTSDCCSIYLFTITCHLLSVNYLDVNEAKEMPLCAAAVWIFFVCCCNIPTS